MKTQNSLRNSLSCNGATSSLQEKIETISDKCIDCNLCQKECEFLRRYGKPKEIADSNNPDNKAWQAISFECSLCRLCAAVCPVKIDPAEMFLQMRREAVKQGNGDFPEHAVILGYERRGTSRRYTWYALPEKCDTIFFPGCALPGTRPDETLRLYEYMKRQIPALGIVLDCCTKPSHDLGRDKYFNAMFGEMKDFLVKNGVRKVFVACPNCFKVFSQYGGELSVETVYELMAKNGSLNRKQVNDTVTIHDPCALRFEKQIHSAVRNLAAKQGLVIKELAHYGKKTICCGEEGLDRGKAEKSEMAAA